MTCEEFKKSDVIEHYIQGKLSEKEREAFGRHFFECDQCFHELKFRKDLIQVCMEHSKELFSEFTNGTQEKRKGKWAWTVGKLFPAPSWQKRWIYAAVSVVLILALISVLITSLRPNKYERLAVIKPYPYLLVGLRHGAKNGERFFNEGMRLYTECHYNTAIRQLKKAVTADPENVLAHFFLGVSFLMEQNPTRAIQNLQKVIIAEPDSEIFHWYLGQAYLMKNEGEKALQEFQKVRDVNGTYRSDAEALIKK